MDLVLSSGRSCVSTTTALAPWT